MGCNWKINVPLIMVAIAQITVLVFGIVEISNPKHNWGFYNRHADNNNVYNNVNFIHNANTHYTTIGCSFHGSTSPTSNPTAPSASPLPSTSSFPTILNSGLGSSSSEDSSLISDSSSSSSSNNDASSESSFIVSSRTQRTTYHEPLWVEAGWKSWCGQYVCGELNTGYGLLASSSALYGAICSIVGAVIILASILVIHINDLKSFMNGKLLVGLVATFILFMFAVTLASWIFWVSNFHHFVHSLDQTYYITYGYCFVLAILGSSMQFFSFLLLFLSRWRSGMEIPIGEDEEDVLYEKVQMIRLSNVM